MGIVLFTMPCGIMPFDDVNVTRLVRQQLSGDIKFQPKVTKQNQRRCIKVYV